MTRRPDVFAISGFMRFYLVFEVIAPLVLMGLCLWAISNPSIELTELGPLILLGLLGWAVWEAVKLVKWYGFRLEIAEEGITARGKTWTWDRIRSARAKTAFKLGTFIELTTDEGETLVIPAAIQQNAIVLTLIEKHVSSLVRES